MIQVYDNPTKWEQIIERAETASNAQIAQRVTQIIQQVRQQGDRALYALAQEIDRVELSDLRVSNTDIEHAADLVATELKTAIGTAAKNIEKFHAAQRFEPIEVQTMQGVRCSQRAVAIERVGLYIPGGTAPLFSTVLMLAIPATVAGCKEVILCTPPAKNGSVAPEILYTAALCGVKHIYKVGGAQAIAAMAYGTETIGRVDKIFGPGNRYVTQAKQHVGGTVCAIDMPAGPSEVMILADDSARPQFVAADMLSQAEHGGDSQAVAVCRSMQFADQVSKELASQTAMLSRAEITAKALENSKIVVFDSDEKMIRFANIYAAEHLIISMRNPWQIAEKITAAGSVFVGNYTPESAGDYASGTNHTLPTSAWARSVSGVNLDSFTRKITYQEITPEGLLNLGSTITTMAIGEGLDAHAAAVKIRLKEIEKR